MCKKVSRLAEEGLQIPSNLAFLRPELLLVATGCCHQLVVAAASRRRTSAAGRRSYAANWALTFYEGICQPVSSF